MTLSREQTLKSVSRTIVSLLLATISSALGKSAGSTTVAPSDLITLKAFSYSTFTLGSLPLMLSFRNTLLGTPIRLP
jgi:hypothetical protein